MFCGPPSLGNLVHKPKSLFFPLYKFINRVCSSTAPTLADIVNPQALDSAQYTYGLWGVLGSLTLFALQAIIMDLRKEWPTLADVKASDLSPQATELNTASTPSDEQTQQNVSFSDQYAGHSQSTPGMIDELRDAPLLQDATLDNFFSRPIKIGAYEWAVGSQIFEKLNPWTRFWEDSKVLARITNYKLLRAKLHVKIVLNGTSFHYGRAIAAYNPLGPIDTITADRPFTDSDVVGASQRPHIWLDPCEGQGGEMEFPFFYHKNLLDITSAEWRNMGELSIHSTQGLKHANDDQVGASSVTVSVFAWATDVKFAVPTQTEAATFTPTPAAALSPQADEYGTKPVSKIATAVADIAGRLTMVPMLGPYARATQLGASAVGKIASLFGYCAPVDLEICQYRPVTTTNIAVTNMPADVAKLSVDAKQELSIDPRIAGLSGVDELAIKSIATRESYLVPFPWATTDVEESLLFNFRVDPGVWSPNGDERHFPACAFVANMFEYWKGSMKYRLQFVCSKFHRGRVKIVYDPSGTPAGAAAYNTAYTQIVDLTETTDFEFTIGWSQLVSYKEHITPATPQGSQYDIAPLSISAPNSPNSNGTVAIYVLNQLSTPNSTVNNDIEVNLFVSCGDDAEFAVPTSRYTDTLRLDAPTISTRAPVRLGHPRSKLGPQATELGETQTPQDTSNAPTNPVHLMNMAQVNATDDNVHNVHFGESVQSLRTVLKRYDRHGYVPGSTFTTGLIGLSVEMPSLPYDVGYYSSGSLNNMTYALASGQYLYGHLPFLRYVTLAFGGWRGAVRWMWDVGRFTSGADPAIIEATRERYARPPGFVYNELPIADNALGMSTMTNISKVASPTGNGQLLQNTSINPLAKFEIPYYSRFRFTPAKRKTEINSEDDLQPGYQMRVTLHADAETPDEFIPSYCAAGEDFTVFFFLGLPPLFYEPLAPST